MKVKKEAKGLCIDLINAHRNRDREEFARIENILENKYNFTPFQLLALFGNPSTIEYGDNNINLVMEDEEWQKV